MNIKSHFILTTVALLPLLLTGFSGNLITTSFLKPVSRDILQGDFTGTYTLSYEGTTLTLAIQQDPTGSIKGTLTSTTGVHYQLEGQVTEGVAVGACYDQQGGVYFEAYFADQQLVFTMIEPDEYNMPNYNTAQTLTFNRSGTGTQIPGMGAPRTAEQKQPSGNAPAPASDIMNQLAGSWTTTTTNTQTWITFRPDGTFSDQYESSYSGNFDNQYGGNEGNWGAYNQQNASGTWTVNGTREQGIITVIYNNGQQRNVEYRVHMEKGQTYWNEYWFNNVFYYRER